MTRLQSNPVTAHEVNNNNTKLRKIATAYNNNWKTVSETIDKIIVFPAGKTFYNANESSENVVIKDGEVVEVLIDMWTDITGKSCSSCINGNCMAESKMDFEDIVGAHVIETPGNMEPGKKAYIIPLCKTCNNQRDAGFKIKLSKTVHAVLLKTIDRNI